MTLGSETLVDTSALPLGAAYLGDGRTAFNVWAPQAERVEVSIVAPSPRVVRLDAAEGGYHQAIVDDVLPGARYLFRFPDGRERPDPASRFQPEGVHKASEVIDPAFDWTDDDWHGISLADYIIYELHVGTFTPEGTFDAVIDQLDMLVELGVTAIEIMPVAQFPGARNWGYDSAYPFATQNSYGGPAGLKRLVDAAHARGLAVVLDVVYNHLGPEGSYLGEFGPYFTTRYQTPWGQALNFDGRESDYVRRYFIDNALQWVTEFHIDALRLDAIHAIVDESARPFLMELAHAVRVRGAELGRKIYTIAESNRNDPKHVTPTDRGGYGLDAQWNDDFEHALRVALTHHGERYYCDYLGLEKLAKAYRDGFAQDGGYSEFHRRRYGAPSHDIAGEQLVVFIQNHDQVGNRPVGERIGADIDFEGQKLAAATVLLAPYLPLLFMGEEYGEPAPFCYFVSHGDPGLQEAVRRGRRAEFAEFDWPDNWPDPARVATFNRSRLKLGLRHEGRHALLWNLYRELIRLRKTVPALRKLSKQQMNVSIPVEDAVLAIHRWDGASQVFALLNFAAEEVKATVSLPKGTWKKLLDTADSKWDGPGATVEDALNSTGQARLGLPPHSAAVWTIS